MSPRTIMFIRHGEKPADHGPPFGVDRHGQPDEHSLSVQGWTRAGALAALFDHAQSGVRPGLVRPARVLATQPTAHYRSKREHDTAEPTAARLGLPIDQDFSHKQVAEAAASVLADHRDTLIVWHHGTIPEFVSQLPLASSTSVPAAWPEDRFDLVWSLSDDGSGHYVLTVIAQDLVAGDSPTA